MRILKWIVDRVRGRTLARETRIGWMPRWEDIDWTGLPFPKDTFDRLQTVDPKQWRSEVIDHEQLFIDLHAHLREPGQEYKEDLICRL